MFRPSLIALVSSAALLGGCSKSNSGTNSTFTSLTNGFGFGQHSEYTYPMHQAIWADFQYKNTNGECSVIWPSVHTFASIQINSNVAIFLGERAREGQNGYLTRIIAYQAPQGPTVDITDQVLKKWSRESGVRMKDILNDSIVGLTQTNGRLKLDFSVVKRDESGSSIRDIVDGAALLSWDEIRAIIVDVMRTGTLRKEQRSGIEYLQKD